MIDYQEWIFQVKTLLALDINKDDDEKFFKSLYEMGYSVKSAGEYYRLLRTRCKETP